MPDPTIPAEVEADIDTLQSVIGYVPTWLEALIRLRAYIAHLLRCQRAMAKAMHGRWRKCTICDVKVHPRYGCVDAPDKCPSPADIERHFMEEAENG